MKFKFLKAAFVGLLLSTSCLVNVANAGIISIENTNTEFSIGNYANLQGLEWLSLDVTLGLSRANVENGFVGNGNNTYTYSSNANRLNDSWRYATTEEVESLINSLTNNLFNHDPKKVTVNQFEAANWFQQNFGFVSIDASHWDYYNYSSFMYGHKEGSAWGGSNYGRIMTGYVSDNAYLGNGYQGSFTKYKDIARINHSRGTVGVNSGYNDIGSMLVRVTQVPEPSTLAIFALGLIGLASRRFKKQ